MSGLAVQEDRNQEATCYVGNLDPRVTEALLWELMLQAGPVYKVSGERQGYGFVEFRTEEDANYSCLIMNMVRLYGKPIRVNKAASDKKLEDFGANLFVGNLDADVDEKLLYDTFSAFGNIINNTPKVMREDNGMSKGYAFVNYDSFESADNAIESMNGQFFCNRQISVQYAFKKDSKERHGSAAERMLAKSQQTIVTGFKPHTRFASGYNQKPEIISANVTQMPAPGPASGYGGVLSSSAPAGRPSAPTQYMAPVCDGDEMTLYQMPGMGYQNPGFQNPMMNPMMGMGRGMMPMGPQYGQQR